jgi:hypothetical protein
MAISADQTLGNGLRHTAADTPGELALTTATTGGTDIAVHRFWALLDAGMHENYTIKKHGNRLFYDNQSAGQHAFRFTLPLHNQPAKQS